MQKAIKFVLCNYSQHKISHCFDLRCIVFLKTNYELNIVYFVLN